MSVSASITKSSSNSGSGGSGNGSTHDNATGNNGCPRTTNKKIRRFPEPESVPQSEESEEERQEPFNPLVCVNKITDNILEVDIDILNQQPIKIYSAAKRNNRIPSATISICNKSRSAGPCSPNNSSSESSTFSTATAEIPRASFRTGPTAIPVRKGGHFGFGYRSQSAFSLLQTQTAHSGHQPKVGHRIVMPCPAKKKNKWDAVMSKIAETKNKAINVRDVKSRVYSAMNMKVTSNTAPILPPNNNPQQQHQTNTNNNNNRKLLINLGNSGKSRHRHLLLHENDHFSSQSSTLSVSDSSSLDENHLRGTRIVPPQLRVKKDAVPVKSRRQMSDLSSASDYSTHHNQARNHQPPRRKPRPSTARVAAAKSHSSLLTTNNMPVTSVVRISDGNGQMLLNNNNMTKTKQRYAAINIGANFASSRPPLISARNVVPTANGTGATVKPNPAKAIKAKDNNDIVLADLRRIHEEDVQKIESNYRDEIDIMKFRHEENMNDLRRLKEEDAKRLEVKYRVEIDALKLRHVELMVDLKGNREENTKRLEINFREELKVMKIQHEDRMEDLRRTHEEHMETLKRSHDDDMQRLEANYQGEIDSIKFQHEDHISELKRIHELDMQRLESNYRGEIEIMKLRHEEHMADQIRKTPGDILHKEIHSLQVVVEIRNQEIKDLRHDLLEAQSKIENLTQTNEQNRALSAKVEDLEAQLAKTRRDKNKILEKFNTMETSMSQVVIENDRLHLYTEELNWRIETLKSDDHVPKSMSKSAIEFGTSYSSD